MMIRTSLLAGVVAISLAACGKEGAKDGNVASTATSENVAAPVTASEAEPEQTIAQALAGSPEHSDLVKALRSAGLEATLAGAGPYTLFAPLDTGFDKLPAATRDSLMRPDEKARTSVITYHIVPGVVTAADLGRAIEAAGGKAVLATLGGGNLTVTGSKDSLLVADAAGGQARLVSPDGLRSNGVVHGIDAVLMPN
jgi:uncharacterized surface protein with fasciclin (FAS1) repeats